MSISTDKTISDLLIVIALSIFILIGGCQNDKKTSVPMVERGTLSWDYAGKLAKLIDKDSLSYSDSLDIADYLYRAAFMDLRLYELQSKLTAAYFWGCHDRCVKRRCSSGDITAATVDYLLKGEADSAIFTLDFVNREIIGTAPEIREIGMVANFTAGGNFKNDWYRPYNDGLIKTPSGIALWAVLSINAGANPKEWIAILTTELKTSEAPSLRYALAYAVMKSGNPLIAWQTMPVYIPGANQIAPPDFEQKIAAKDSSILSPVYLTLNQYIISKIETAFLQDFLQAGSLSAGDSTKKIIMLARLKGIDVAFDKNKPEYQSYQAALSNQFAGMISLYLEASKQNNNKAAIKEQLFSKIETIKSIDDWELKILLALALDKILSGPEVLTRISEFIPQDSSLAEYSPEWLAIYAAYCVGDNTKSERLARIGNEFKQVYPYAPGIAELIGKINRICN